MEPLKRRCSFMGVTVDLLTMQELTSLVVESVNEDHRQVIIANHNLHSVFLSSRDMVLRDFHAVATVSHIDGMSLVALGRLLGHPINRWHRTTYVDWAPRLLSVARENGWRVAHVGSTHETCTRAVAVIGQQYPGLDFRAHHGYFDASPSSVDNVVVVDWVEAQQPNILMVGMGMPRQERWILENVQRLRTVNVLLPSGACLDYIAGSTPTPPRWLSRIGLEWLARLAHDPRRLSSRYLIEPAFLAPRFVSELASRIARYAPKR